MGQGEVHGANVGLTQVFAKGAGAVDRAYEGPIRALIGLNRGPTRALIEPSRALLGLNRALIGPLLSPIYGARLLQNRFGPEPEFHRLTKPNDTQTHRAS